MLAHLDKVKGYHKQALIDCFKWMIERPVSSLMTIFVIAIALALPGSFWVISDNLKGVTSHWEQSGHISLYITPGLAKAKLAKILSDVKATSGVGKATLISPDEGLKVLQGQEGMQDIMRYLPANPLPAVIDVLPAIQVNTPLEMEDLYTTLKALPAVDEAKMDMAWLERVHAIIEFVRKVGHTLLGILAIAVMIIVGNTLRLAIQSHYDEVAVLKLVGATDAYIIRPFLYAGMCYAILGAVLAIVIIQLLTWQVSVGANQIGQLYDMHYPFHGLLFGHCLIILMFAAILGWIGAMLSIKRQLMTIEPCH